MCTVCTVGMEEPKAEKKHSKSTTRQEHHGCCCSVIFVDIRANVYSKFPPPPTRTDIEALSTYRYGPEVPVIRSMEC
jgi:hypothetical protein